MASATSSYTVDDVHQVPNIESALADVNVSGKIAVFKTRLHLSNVIIIF